MESASTNLELAFLKVAVVSPSSPQKGVNRRIDNAMPYCMSTKLPANNTAEGQGSRAKSISSSRNPY